MKEQFECADCGKTLHFDVEEKPWAGLRVYRVEPCPECIGAAVDDAFVEGYESCERDEEHPAA